MKAMKSGTWGAKVDMKNEENKNVMVQLSSYQGRVSVLITRVIFKYYTA